MLTRPVYWATDRPRVDVLQRNWSSEYQRPQEKRKQTTSVRSVYGGVDHWSAARARSRVSIVELIYGNSAVSRRSIAGATLTTAHSSSCADCVLTGCKAEATLRGLIYRRPNILSQIDIYQEAFLIGSANSDNFPYFQ